MTAVPPPARPTGGRPSARRPLVLLATCRDLPDLDAEGQGLLRALRGRGADARPAVWDDGGEDWAAADLVVVRSTWDYVPRRADFLAWAERVAAVTALDNPPDLLRWSTDKTYLEDLRAAGLPVVPSALLAPGDGEEHPFLDREHVVKPTVSAGSKDTLRLGAEEVDRSRAHVRAVHASGRTALVQPYLAGVDDHGETAVVLLDGRVSHAARKGPLLRRSADLVDGLFAPEQITAREPSAAEADVARRALEVVRARTGATPLYARVDLLPSPDGPLLLELELAEPSLFLEVAPGATEALAAAVIARAAAPGG
ncbi:RimK family alpha-L-glutamate ligase [uncultured Pseudokineococcus sp.]|uniref:ATP-grasp domain-containing protein n=1 Tax=uncultured Pseudokineococcus sp. TaxID=1642928 RepID=UPI00260B5A41|nr:hypothetical protein [uncultured Pseudokineococcus sp.]